ncbi:MAG TPA: hypothetical protein VFG24_07925 [Nitrosopumilaceae archaeon]|nr:hypothetical protein [Nitrosopumilaceae archaeon]
MVSTFVKRAIIIGLAGIAAIIILYAVDVSNMCPIKQINVLNDIQKYDTTKNPELCDDINNRIIQLNNQCGIEMEILDCG